jgi:hypothetical protein
MFIARCVNQVSSSVRSGMFRLSLHSAPDGAWLDFSHASYKHLAPDGAKTCPPYLELTLLTFSVEGATDALARFRREVS